MKSGEGALGHSRESDLPDVEVSPGSRLLAHREDCLSSVVPTQTTHCATPAGAGPAEQHRLDIGGDAPLPGWGVECLRARGPGPREVAVEDMAAGHREVVLDVLRHLGLDARAAVGSEQHAVEQRLVQVYVDRGDRAAYGLVALGGTVVLEQ